MSLPRIVLRYLALLTLSFAAAVVPLAAQETPSFDQGLKEWGSFHGADIDSVILINGKLNLHIPLLSYPQRGGKSRAGFFVSFPNPDFSKQTICAGRPLTCKTVWSANAMGVQINPDFDLLLQSYLISGATHYLLRTPDGAAHNVESTSNGYVSLDGTGFHFDPNSNTAIDRNGVRYFFSTSGPDTYSPGKIEDPNGNIITGASTAWTDTLGRTLPPAPTEFGGGTSTTDFTHCAGPLPTYSAYLWTLPGPSGGTTTFKVCVAQVQLIYPSTTCGFNCYPVNRTSPMIQSIVLPNNSAWAFEYTTNGFLSRIDFPTGGSISYGGAKTLIGFCSGDNTTSNPTTYVIGGLSSRSVDSGDGTGAHQWTYSTVSSDPNLAWYVVGVTDPLGNQTLHTLTAMPQGSPTCAFYETQTQYYQGSSSSGTLLKTVVTEYANAALNPFDVRGAINVFPTRITTTWPNGQVTKVEEDYDTGTTLSGSSQTVSYGTDIARREYDYGSSSPGSLLRQTKVSYVWQSNSSYLTNNLLTYPSSTQVLDGSGAQRAYTLNYYDQYSLTSSGISTQHDSSPPNGSYRANRTSTARWLNGSTTSTTNCPISVSNGYLNSYSIFFDTGTVQKATDSCGAYAGDPNHSTTYAYSSTYAGAWLTSITNALNQSTSLTYDFNTGAVTSRTDPNNQTTTYQHSDSLGRLTEVDYPDGGITKNFYTDTALAVNVETQRQIDSTRWTDSFVVYDGLARPVVQSVANDEATPWDRTDTCYDALGRLSFTSYRYLGSSATSAPNCAGTGDTFAPYDGLSRLQQLTHSDGTTVLTAYTGRATQVQDEGNGTRRVTRISQVDGLGQLAGVCEVTSGGQLGPGGTPGACGLDISATGFLTTYGYDTLGNVTSVSQNGLNGRSFQYDSLSRLTSASNPESGTASYGYDANGNVITKTDARGTTTTSTYDFLNRITAKNYSDSTHGVTLQYDQTSIWGVNPRNPIGRLTSTIAGGTSGCADDVFSYDSMGRVVNQWKSTPYNCGTGSFLLSYAYDLAGDITSSTNGAGVTFTYSVNRATRLASMTSSWVDANHPGTLFSGGHYNATSALTSASIGNVITETRTYDARLRLASITDGSNYSLTIPLGGYGPNSDILAANDSVNGNWTYSYDDFNRLSGSNQNSGQAVYSYVYDRFGNRWQQNGPHSMQLSFSGANNRMDGYSYDAAGNLWNDGSHQYFYDAESRLIQVDGTLGNCSTATACYVYDASGQRVQKNNSSGAVNYLYDLVGHPITEIGSNGVWDRGEIYAGDRHIATYANSTTYFIHPDWLGTERARANVSGSLCETITSLPFGDGQSTSGSCSDVSTMHFTGKPRDAESNLDYFGARYDASSFGRFMSPDWSESPTPIPYASLPYPQSLNLYSYVQNNPLKSTDPNGHCTVDGEQHGSWWCFKHWAGWAETKKETAAREKREAEWAAFVRKHPEYRTENLIVGTLVPVLTMAAMMQADPPGGGGDSTVPEEQATAIEAGAATGVARTMVNGVPQPAPEGEIIVAPNGNAVKIPAGYVAEPAANGNGIVYRPAGSTGNANIIRVSGPNAQNPTGYIRIYNSEGQPIIPSTGKPGSDPQTHIPQ